MNRLNSRLALLLTIASMLAMVPAIGADVIAPSGSTTNLNPANAGDLPTGPILATLSGTFKGLLTGNPSGTYTTEVVRNGNGFLDFVYQFTNTGAKDSVDSVTMANFAGFTTDVFEMGPGQDADEASSTGLTPDDIKFFFSVGSDNDDVGPGQSSETLVIATNAIDFTNGIFTLQDGDTSSVAAFEPAGQTRITPEPGSMLLFGTGLSAVAATLRRRTKKAGARLTN